MQKHEWMHTRIPTKSHELEDGSQEDNCPIQMPWIHLQDEQEEGLQDRKSIIMYLKICQEEASFKEEEEEDIPDETSGK